MATKQAAKLTAGDVIRVRGRYSLTLITVEVTSETVNLTGITQSGQTLIWDNAFAPKTRVTLAGD